MKPRLYIQQKITAFVNQYKAYGADDNGAQADMMAFAEQKRFAFKEKVSFYADEQKKTVAYTFRAEKALDIHGRFFIEDPEGVCIGMFRKDFTQSLAISTWIVMDKDGKDLFKVTESSVALALFRRYAGWIPVLGEMVEIITMFLRYHFVFTDVDSNTVVGKYEKTTLFRDHYVMQMTDKAYAKCDKRALAALGVALDALQSR